VRIIRKQELLAHERTAFFQKTQSHVEWRANDGTILLDHETDYLQVHENNLIFSSIDKSVRSKSYTTIHAGQSNGQRTLRTFGWKFRRCSAMPHAKISLFDGLFVTTTMVSVGTSKISHTTCRYRTSGCSPLERMSAPKARRSGWWTSRHLELYERQPVCSQKQ
jgi:hypothetical protein